MRHLLAASLLLYAAIPLLVGCSATLDFDSVVGGEASGDGDGDDNPIQRPDAGTGDQFSCDDYEGSVTFCDDFDGQTFDFLWAPLRNPTSSVVKNDSIEALSAPNSLYTSVEGGFDPGAYVNAAVQKKFQDLQGEKFSGLIEFDMYVEQFDPTAGARVTAFQFLFGNETNSYNQIVLNIDSRESSLASLFTESWGTDYGSQSGEPRPVPAPREWAHVTIRLDINDPTDGGPDDPEGDENRVTMDINGIQLVNAKLTTGLRGLIPRMELGIPWQEVGKPNKAWAIRYDNVLVALEPKE